jgi:hypothetical protein
VLEPALGQWSTSNPAPRASTRWRTRASATSSRGPRLFALSLEQSRTLETRATAQSTLTWQLGRFASISPMQLFYAQGGALAHYLHAADGRPLARRPARGRRGVLPRPGTGRAARAAHDTRGARPTRCASSRRARSSRGAEAHGTAAQLARRCGIARPRLASWVRGNRHRCPPSCHVHTLPSDRLRAPAGVPGPDDPRRRETVSHFDYSWTPAARLRRREHRHRLAALQLSRRMGALGGARAIRSRPRAPRASAGRWSRAAGSGGSRPRGTWVVYLAEQDTDEVKELYAVPIDGQRAAGCALNAELAPGADVHRLRGERQRRARRLPRERRGARGSTACRSAAASRSC